MTLGDVQLDAKLVTHMRGHTVSTPPLNQGNDRLRQTQHATSLPTRRDQHGHAMVVADPAHGAEVNAPPAAVLVYDAAGYAVELRQQLAMGLTPHGRWNACAVTSYARAFGARLR